MKAIYLFAAFLLSLPLSAEAAAPDCTLTAMAALDLQTTSDGRVTIPVKIEGHDYRFLVDTGGYINTVSSRVVADQQYHPVSAVSQLRGLGKTRLNTVITVRDFVVGSARANKLNFFVDDFNDPEWDGTLAPEVLANYDADFDFAHDKLNLISPNRCPGKVAYWTNTLPAIVPMEMQNYTHIRVPVKIDGKEITATLDTGSPTSFLTLRAASRYLGIDEKNPGLRPLGDKPINGKTAPVYEYSFGAMTVGDEEHGQVTVIHPQIVIISNNVWYDDDLLLGQGILRQMHMYIAYKEKKLYLTSAAAGKAPN